jgi:hypothetical protein
MAGGRSFCPGWGHQLRTCKEIIEALWMPDAASPSSSRFDLSSSRRVQRR